MTRVPVIAVLLGLAPAAEAAQYLDPAAWAQATARTLRRAEYRMFPGYAVEFRDSFGTWHPGETGEPVEIGNGQVADRRYAPQSAFLVLPGNWGGGFTCFSFVYPCLGINSATYTLPFKIIGITGQLTYSTDSMMGFGRTGIDLFDNAAFDQAVGGAPRYAGFFGLLLDRPTRVFEADWLAPLSDFYAGFSLTDARVLVKVPRDAVLPAATRSAAPVAVPEPPALGVLGAGLLGLFLLSRRGDRRVARPRPSTARPGRAIPPARCPG
jgi:hypothetical protein